MTEQWPGPWGAPVASAHWKQKPEDFRVEEIWSAPEEAVGEHILLDVEKTGQNTDWVARNIARFAGVRDFDVGLHGLKDRHAVTRQWMSVYLGKRPEPDWSRLDIEGTRLLSVSRTQKKLRRGEHHGNRFQILLTEVAGDREQIEARLQQIRESGFPNYFGPQRFGREGNNLRKADDWFAGKFRPSRSQKSLYLSAVRSKLFNDVLAERIRLGSWNQEIEGDSLLPAASTGSGVPVPAGPLPGGSEFQEGAAGDIERRILTEREDWLQALHREGVRTAYRPLVAEAADLGWEWVDDGLLVQVSLGSGTFASVLLEQCFELH